ncbi:hypothetical protein BDZ45DRAFT_672949 [Acephala macrosclerotiorum]|nr:hypothetical protein BDZ45DRAFT_672949 [Acephala macrosclerotiorum]
MISTYGLFAKSVPGLPGNSNAASIPASSCLTSDPITSALISVAGVSPGTIAGTSVILYFRNSSSVNSPSVPISWLGIGTVAAITTSSSAYSAFRCSLRRLKKKECANCRQYCEGYGTNDDSNLCARADSCCIRGFCQEGWYGHDLL